MMAKKPKIMVTPDMFIDALKSERYTEFYRLFDETKVQDIEMVSGRWFPKVETDEEKDVFRTLFELLFAKDDRLFGVVVENGLIRNLVFIRMALSRRMRIPDDIFVELARDLERPGACALFDLIIRVQRPIMASANSVAMFVASCHWHAFMFIPYLPVPEDDADYDIIVAAAFSRMDSEGIMFLWRHGFKFNSNVLLMRTFETLNTSELDRYLFYRVLTVRPDVWKRVPTFCEAQQKRYEDIYEIRNEYLRFVRLLKEYGTEDAEYNGYFRDY